MRQNLVRIPVIRIWQRELTNGGRAAGEAEEEAAAPLAGLQSLTRLPEGVSSMYSSCSIEVRGRDSRRFFRVRLRSVTGEDKLTLKPLARLACRTRLA